MKIILVSRVLMVTILLLCCGYASQGQSPSIYFSVTYIAGTFTCGCPFDSGSDEALQQNFFGKPTSIDVTTHCEPPSGNYTKNCTFSFSSADCYSTGGVTWHPTPPAATGTSPGIICTSDVILLSAPPAYNAYVWECKIVDLSNNVTSKSFSSTGPAMSVGFQDIFGANNYSGLNSNIYFRYGVPTTGNGCNSTFYSPYSASPYVFMLDNLLMSSASSASAPTCQGGLDGSAVITLNRGLVTGETVSQLGFYSSSTSPYGAHAGQDMSNPTVGGMSGRDITVTTLPSGVWYALIQNNLGVCGDSGTGNISLSIPTGPRKPLSATLAVTSNYHGAQISCNGLSDGEVTVSPNGGGNGSYMYSLDGGSYQNSSVFSGLSPGSHGVTVKDGCSTPATPTTAITNSVVITAPSAISIASIYPSTCNNSNNGQISINGSGGTAPYEYSVDGGSKYLPGNFFTNLVTPSIYDVKIKDINNCQSTLGSVTLVGPLVAGSVVPPTCLSTPVTSLAISGASGGSGNLEWEIHDASTNALVGGASSLGNPILVSPGSYYAKVIDSSYPTCTTATSTFTVNSPLLSSINQTKFIDCFGQSTGVLVANPSGGVSPYGYSWSNGTAVVATSQTANSIPVGIYSVTVTDSKGCQNTSSISIAQPTPLVIGTPILSDHNTFNISCNGGSDGSIDLAPSGGSPPYSFTWLSGETSQNLSGLRAGNYSVKVTDLNGCSISKGISLKEPPALSVRVDVLRDITCFGDDNGSITVAHSGGVGAISYGKNNWTSAQSDTIFTALSPGTYTIYAIDQNNCRANSSPILITSPTVLEIFSITVKDPQCNGDANGKLTIIASGGTGPYQFSNGGAFKDSTTFSGLTAGRYILSVRDRNGCTISSSPQGLSDPDPLVLSSAAAPQSCVANIDGSISLCGTGGTSLYAFSIDGGKTYQSNVLTATFSALPSGTYSASIKDDHGCTASKFVGINLQTPLAANIALSSPIDCFGLTTGALSTSVSGGTTPYSYTWSNGATTQNIKDLPAGTYSVTITDSRNCNVGNSSTITQPSQLLLSSTTSNYKGYGVSCENSRDGFINATASGGTSPYTFAWIGGATTNSISGLTSGIYTVSVTDTKNCKTNLPVSLLAPPTLGLAIDSIKTVTCHGGSDGSFTISESGGVTGYMYSLDSATWQPSSTFHLLKTGSYVVYVRDGNNCTAKAPVKIPEPSPISITIASVQNAGCNLSDGSIESWAIGGTGALRYIWKNASSKMLGSLPKLTNAPSGVYSLTVTDQSQCVNSAQAAISNPNGPTFSIVNQISTTCSNTSDGEASVLVENGPPPYTINWSSGESGPLAVGLSPGINTVTVTDNNNCSSIQTFVTTSPPAISLNSIINNSPTCPGGSDGSIQVTANGGNAPYSYSWNGKAGNSQISNLKSGAYSLRVVDASGCTYSKDVGVQDVPPIVVTVLNEVPPLCSVSADGSLFVQAYGGNGSLTYSWNSGRTGPQLNSIAAGAYVVTVEDSKNCLQQKSIDLLAPAPVSQLLVTSATLCHGENTGAIAASATGGAGEYFFSKDNGNVWQSQNSFAALPAGNYSILARDKNGCSVSSEAIIVEPAPIDIMISKTDPTCGQANGSAQATVTGGTGRYTYQWNNSVNQILGGGAKLQGASSEVYTLKVVDTNNCFSLSSLTMAPYRSAQFSVTGLTSTSCSDLQDGAASVQITSIDSPYSLTWSNGETSIATRNLGAGPQSVTVADVNNCKVTKTFLVPAPLPITLTSEMRINPPCTGRAGSIQVTAVGGTGNLVYQWNGVFGTNTVQGIKAGSYELIVNDTNGCKLSKRYVLSDPPPFTINLGADKTICPNTTTAIGLTLPGAVYGWSGPNNFLNSHGIIEVGTAGEYYLTITNSNGCKASDNIAIAISNNLLRADFLLASKAHVGDTLEIIDISWPIPDKIRWKLSSGATLIYEDTDYALITFSSPGDFKIGLVAMQGGCYDESYQIVSIDELPKGGTAKHETDDLEVSSVTVYPNPFVGKARAKIELPYSATCTLKVYSMLTNALVMSQEFQGDKIYNAEIDFNGCEAGLYIIVVESGSNAKAVRVIKL